MYVCMHILSCCTCPFSQYKTNLKATELQNMEFQQTIEELNIQLKRKVRNYYNKLSWKDHILTSTQGTGEEPVF